MYICGLAAHAGAMTWHARLKERVGSNRKAAERLFSDWRKTARKEVELEKSTVTAVENKLGSLHREGDRTGWWAKRPRLQQILAELLDLEVDEIFGAPSRADGMVFREFPALQPLNRDEQPVRTSRSGSVFDLVVAALNREGSRCNWIVAPPGAGKSLAVKLLSARFSREVLALTVVQLRDAVPFVGNEDRRALVVEVEESESVSDLSAASALEQHQNAVVVLAPFRHPDEGISEWRTSVPEDPPRGSNGVWTTTQWTPDAGWIARMLDWVGARLEFHLRDTKFAAADVIEWLDKTPWVRRAIQTPGELLALCADFDKYGTEGTPDERARRWLGTIGVKALPDDAPSTWVTHEAEKSIVAMIEAHALDRSTVMDERSFAGWATVVPPAAHGSELTVGYLRRAGLLRAAERGVTFFPKWAADALAQRRVTQFVRALKVAEWGALAGDASRQHLVDGALDGLSKSQLRSAAEAVVEGDTKAVGFAEVAALEALVAALGRRLVADDNDTDTAKLAKRALLLQLGHLVTAKSIGELPLPLTRRDRDEWFLSGWAISLAASGETERVSERLRWVLPGWSEDLLLSEADPNELPWETSSAAEGLRALAPKLVARLSPSSVPWTVPRLLLPPLFLAEGWELAFQHLNQIGGRREEVVLIEEAKKLDPKRRAALATRLWGIAGEVDRAAHPTPVAVRLTWLQNQYPRLLHFVRENLPASVVEETARNAGTHRISGAHVDSVTRALSLLAPDQRAAAVRGRLTRAIRFDEMGEIVRVLDARDLEMLLDVVRDTDTDVAWAFTKRMWSDRPELAAAEARRAFEEKLHAAEAWFRNAPRSRLGALIDLAQEARERPMWLREWGLARLPDAGVHSESLFRLMQLESR